VRLKGRLQTVFAAARISTGLSIMETMVLTAVVEASQRPTVSQIGRSLGHPRQVVQRAANRLIDARLLATAANPEHKRAQLLHATAAGRKLFAEAEMRARKSADELAKVLGLRKCEQLARDLHELRSEIEAHLRSTGIRSTRAKRQA
jgi:DNA-binding MarR family transcriptional regulator